jgi:hypothetical protein
MSTLLINTEKSKFEDSKDSGIIQGGSFTADTDKMPRLEPLGIIDVVSHFSWYAGPQATKRALDQIPSVFLLEREQMLSSLIQGSLYYATNTLAGGSDIISSAGNVVKNILGQGRVVTDAVDGITKAGVGLLNSVSSRSKSNTQESGDDQLLKSHNLNSLNGIYYTKPTGFQYRFPKYEFQGQGAAAGAWGTDPGTPLLSKIVGYGTQMVDNLSKLANFSSPGVYIEKPKYFQTAESGESHSVEFPLINTVKRHTFSPVQQNYELLWLLAFQNKPYKTSFARTPPPKIYSVTCPGQFSMPYAYISGMTVNFQGTVRNREVYIPTGDGEKMGHKRVEVPVPEAYMVKLEFTSLLGDYGNTMISNAQNTSINSRGRKNRVEFGSAFSGTDSE